jgi:hypothetical protein
LQANNDYIYKCATISDTLIPAVDDCSILATTNNSYYTFVGSTNAEYKEIPATQSDKQNGVLKDVEAGFIQNPEWDAITYPDAGSYPLKGGDKPKQQYPAKFKMIPNTKYVLDLQNGNLKRYNFNNQNKTKTALDPTFYP